ncbi:MAG TPA: hypothetical protein VGR30_12215 [Candidatus Binatia bacterium]|nr:hypothetical protein [Candidatus Binatia bacterium]
MLEQRLCAIREDKFVALVQLGMTENVAAQRTIRAEAAIARRKTATRK